MRSLDHARAFFRLARADTKGRSWKQSGRFISSASTSGSAPESNESPKPYYVTSPIFYVNAAPHVGHLYTLVLTDIYKRWAVLRGQEAVMLTGTDEHGMKIQTAAKRAGIDTKLFCDETMSQFDLLTKRADISHNRFIRTTDQDHKDTVARVWEELDRQGYIFQSEHEGWYSVSDETFVPPSAVHLIRDPASGRKMMVSNESGREVEWTSETNYHFKLSAFQDQLLDHYRKNPHWIQPKQRMNQLVQEVESGLQDLSISRPISRLTWGIRVPTDPSQTIYVWLDALINYLTHAGYPTPNPSLPHPIWPPNLQIVGKDILRFHGIYQPAFLMALSLPQAHTILTHAHWTMNQTKMSKSSHNGVNPFYALDRFSVDPLRFYLAYDGALTDDASYDNSFIVNRYKTLLQADIGNLLSRLTRTTRWDVRACITHAVTLPPPDQTLISPGHGELVARLRDDVDVALTQAFDPRRALRLIMRALAQTNKLLAEQEIWVKAASTDPKDRDALAILVYYAADTLRVAGILLGPFMPGKSGELLDALGVDKGKRGWEDAVVGRDKGFGVVKEEGNEGKKRELLFPPLVSEG